LYRTATSRLDRPAGTGLAVPSGQIEQQSRERSESGAGGGVDGERPGVFRTWRTLMQIVGLYRME